MNFDGLVGPTHHYGGLSFGNLASMEHSQLLSNPKQAALQGLEKMRLLTSMGIKQGLLPPHERPFLPLLRSLGFYGSDADLLRQVWKTDPALLMACSSSAYMWAANAATVSPSADSIDGRVHFTPANLVTAFHRSFEPLTTGKMLYRLFNHPAHFVHHFPLPPHPCFADEGAANHTRFCRTFDQPGIQLFVFGKRFQAQNSIPQHFPARQTEEASRTLSRLHLLKPTHVVFAQQNPEAIDAGVFHNDVISVGHQNVFLYHERAFINTERIIQELTKRIETHCQIPFFALEIKEKEIPLSEVTRTYLFNSQIVTHSDGTMILIAPQECQSSPLVSSFLKELTEKRSSPLHHVIYQNLKESMQNGGGPACLRLRVVLTEQEYKMIHPGVELNEVLYKKLVTWIEKHYRDQLRPEDLTDPQLLKEGRAALDELSRLLQLGSIYSFQTLGPLPPLPEKKG